jgi:hypothetical protein
MRIELRNGIFKVADENKVSLINADNVQIKCLEGRVWLTVDGMTYDYVLKAGEQIVVKGNGLALLQGVPLATIELSQCKSASKYQSQTLFDWACALFNHQIVV